MYICCSRKIIADNNEQFCYIQSYSYLEILFNFKIILIWFSHKKNQIKVFKMEKVCKRFPRLGKGVLSHLGNKSLVQFREVCKLLKNFVDEEKTLWIRMIQRHATNFSESEDWQKSISKISINTIKEFASVVNQFSQHR